MDGLPRWVISSMPGPLLRQHKHERRYTSSVHLFILTRRIWKDDYDGQMIFGDLAGLKLPDICLTGEEKPRKSTQETCPDRGLNPGPLRARCACYRLSLVNISIRFICWAHSRTLCKQLFVRLDVLICSLCLFWIAIYIFKKNYVVLPIIVTWVQEQSNSKFVVF